MNQETRHPVLESFAFGFKTIIFNIIPVFISVFVVWLISWGLKILLASLLFGAETSLRVSLQGIQKSVGFVFSFEWGSLIDTIIYLISSLLIYPIYITLGVSIFAHFGFMAMDHKPVTLAIPSVWRMFKVGVAKIIQWTIALFGLIFFVFPGIYWIIRTQFIAYAIIDKNAGIFSAFGQSFALTKGRTGTIFCYLVLSIIATAFIISFPLAIFAGAYLYRFFIQNP